MCGIYTDSEYAWDLDKRMSFSSYIFTLFGNTINNLQNVVALSTIKAEYMACT